MRVKPLLERLMAVGFCLLLLSCGVTRPAMGPTGPRDLGRYVLRIEQGPDGQVIHSWKPMDDVDSTVSPHVAPHDAQGRIVQVALDRDCEAENVACISMCVDSLKGRNWSHMKKASKREHCQTRCMPAYRDCCRLRELAEGQTVEFHTTGAAIEWLKRHREKVWAGAFVVIAGVTFVVVVGGSGGAALLLVPVIVLADSKSASETRFTGLHP